MRNLVRNITNIIMESLGSEYPKASLCSIKRNVHKFQNEIVYTFSFDKTITFNYLRPCKADVFVNVRHNLKYDTFEYSISYKEQGSKFETTIDGEISNKDGRYYLRTISDFYDACELLEKDFGIIRVKSTSYRTQDFDDDVETFTNYLYDVTSMIYDSGVLEIVDEEIKNEYDNKSINIYLDTFRRLEKLFDLIDAETE